MAFDPLDWIDDELDALEALGLRRRLQVRGGAQAAEVEWGGRTVVNFGSNDYLGLAQGDLTEAVRQSLDVDGWGAGASPLVTGRSQRHAALEVALAEFEGTEAALVFPSGFAANVGTVAALAGRGDLILSDSKNHASLIDGCRLSGARVQIYPHGHPEVLEKYLTQAGGFRRRLIVTDSLFSMDGDFAPLPELVELARRSEAILVVDEAHATGVFGERGRGVCEELGVEQDVPVRIGTLSKALGSSGGFVVGRRSLIDWLANRARPYVFSTAAPAACAAAALEALRIVREEPRRRVELLARAAELRAALRSQGWYLGDCVSQIIPVRIGDPVRTMNMMQRLLDAGLFVPGIRPPSVPDGESLLRISLSWRHDEKQLAALVAEFEQLRRA